MKGTKSAPWTPTSPAASRRTCSRRVGGFRHRAFLITCVRRT